MTIKLKSNLYVGPVIIFPNFQHCDGNVYTVVINILIFDLLNTFLETWKHIYIFHHYATLKWIRELKSFLIEDKVPFELHCQYHGCWWPGDKEARSSVAKVLT